MKNLLTKVNGYFATFSTGAAAGLLRLQSDFDYDYDYSTSTSDAGGFLILALGCVALVIALAMVAFNIWMIVDVAKRDFESKTLWLVILIVTLFFGGGLFGFIASLIYFFAVRAPMVKTEKGTMPASKPADATGGAEKA